MLPDPPKAFLVSQSASNLANGTVGSWLAILLQAIQLKILGQTFRLTSGAIVNAKKLTLCWVLSHDAKKRETETEPEEVLASNLFFRKKKYA